MQTEEREQIAQVLQRISREAWNDFLDSDDGQSLRRRLDAVREALLRSASLSPGAARRPTSEVIDLLGHRLLSDRIFGSWVRRQILEALPPTKWQRLADMYREIAGSRAEKFHRNMTQQGSGSLVMAEYWHQGSRWAEAFCDVTGMPKLLAYQRGNTLPDDEEIIPALPAPPLHDFQEDVYESIGELLAHGTGEASLLSLPTGAGKTRVAVEALCDHLATSRRTERGCNIVIWIAQSQELQQQAWECFRQVWQTPPQRRNGEPPIRRPIPLALVRAWGGRKTADIEIGDGPTVIIAGIDQLASWEKRNPDFFESFPRRRIVCTVIDEAHGLITNEHRRVLIALGLRAKHHWRPLQGAAPVIGLTATPWRSNEVQDSSLRGFFQKRLLTPERLGVNPIATLQRRGILAKANWERLPIEGTPAMTDAERARFEQYKDLPSEYLERLGETHIRNAQILQRLLRLPKRNRAIVFACSVEHAEVLTLALNRAADRDVAAVVSGRTPRAERAMVIEQFRGDGELRFLCNVGVLTTGFDAPKADVVCITRPTTSAALYEQMVGRGLRGPRNGGTEECLVLDVQDEGLPGEIMSYGRVKKLWADED